MLNKTNLEKMGFSSEDAERIIELNSKYAHIIAPIVKKYTDDIDTEKPFEPYKDAESGNIATQRADDFIKDVQTALPELDEYASRLVGWINCVPFLYETYKQIGISEELFFDTMKDFSYKLQECKTLHNAFGLFVDWFFIIFELKAIALGRLEFEVKPFGREEYSCGGYTLKKGEYTYSCHIPSSGKLTVDMCMDSFHRAYEFFKPQLKGDVIPIVSYTWLFYKPYLEKVFAEGSNLKKFADLFDIIGNFSSEDNFKDCWRIFNKKYDGTTENLPADTSLRRSFINYINNGGDFGVGYGILFYNGKTKEILK